MFNTILLELTLLGKSKIDVKKASLEGLLPKEFEKLETKRDYYSCVLVDFKFRGIPQRVNQQQHFAFGGKATVNFVAYALNSEELEKINQELEKEDIGDALGLIEGITTDSLGELQKEIDFFLKDTDEAEEKQSQGDGSNPFLALIGHYDKPAKKNSGKVGLKKSKVNVIIKKEGWIEKTHLRELAKDKAKENAFDLFDVYKKAHGMSSYT